MSTIGSALMSVVIGRPVRREPWLKRPFDLVIATIGMIVLSPLFGAIAAAIKLDSSGPVMYRATRSGRHGRPFTMYKFRTMQERREVHGPKITTHADRRITRVGRLLRPSRLDELPQLWNVLRGEMSIVGPRPERPEVASSLEAAVPFWSRRLLVKPGVTGWAQVSCGYVADCDGMADKLAYDLWYLRNQSVLVDLAICIRTVGQQLGALLPGRSTARGVVR
jgi:lipopolysaccharide/colanic/teichoic acid biosynthesis glycosyltransferase